VLAELGRCGAPCDGRQSVDEYADLVATVRSAIEADGRPVIAALLNRIETLAALLRYEDAAAQRDRLAAFVRAAARGQRLAALTSCAQIVAARPTNARGYEVVVVRFGRLAATGTVPPGAAPRPYIDALLATAETVIPDGFGPTAYACAQEIECVLRWLEAPGVRLVDVDGAWACPAYGAGGQRVLLDLAIELAPDADPFGDRRALRPVHRPAREQFGSGARAS
jgi:DNA polymerase-3 subunit epsilon